MKTILSIGLVLLCLHTEAQTPLLVPDTLVGPNITLTMHKDSVQFFPTGSKTYTYAYNQYSYLGPTLIFEKGQNMNMVVNNNINDTTTLHWHGIHLPSNCDGGPHTKIMAGDSWNPQFTVMDKAATYWYHPHMHMKTAIQAIKGAAGIIIVRDPNEAALSLPRKYGVDDFPLVIQCQQYDANNQAMPLGMQDSTIMVNGAMANNGHSVFGNFPAQIVRLRILNGSGERAFNFGLSGNIPFKQIASDGGLLNQPFDTTRVRLSPGERAEIVINLTGMEGQIIHLMSYASELPMGVQGGPTMPMPAGSPPMDSPLNGVDFNVLQINVVSQTANPITTIPTVLENDLALDPATADVTRTIRFTADSLMVMDGPFYFNDSSFNMDRIDLIIPLNNTEVWKLVNETMVGHPFHIHDIQFYLVDRNGSLPHDGEKGRKDVVFIPTGDSVLFVTKFEDFADSVIPYMYHCHILMHEDAGMMGQFLVVPPGFVGVKNNLVLANSLLIYPNPTTDFLKFKLNGNDQSFDLRIIDNLGQVIVKKDECSLGEIDVSFLKNGNYHLLIRTKNNYYNANFIKN
ncbi:MAG: multicopper oxidase domain-containing protein [Crocinitomicaceae bacterium]